MKLENVEVSSQGSLALQLHEAKSKSKSGGRQKSSRAPAQAPQAGMVLGTSLCFLLPSWEAHKGHSVGSCQLPHPCSPAYSSPQEHPGTPGEWVGLHHGPGV